MADIRFRAAAIALACAAHASCGGSERGAAEPAGEPPSAPDAAEPAGEPPQEAAPRAGAHEAPEPDAARDLDGLIERVIAALATDDVEAAVALLAPIERTDAACPEAKVELSNLRSEQEEDIRSRFSSCADRIDWARAEIPFREVRSKGDLPAGLCSEPVELVGEVMLRIRAGDREFDLRLDNTLQIGDEVYLTGDKPLTCIDAIPEHERVVP